MSAAASLLRTLRFRAWVLATRVRLARHGIRLDVRAQGTPRFHTLPRVELGLGDVAAAGAGSFELRLGRDVRLGRELILQVSPGAASRLDAGDGTVFESWCRVQLEGGVIALGRDVHVRDLVLLKSKSSLEVGDGSVLSRGVAVHATAGVRIGAHCGIGERTSIIDSDHTMDGSDRAPLHTPLKTGPVEIDDHALISANVVILRGTHVGAGAVVAANAVCNGVQIPEGWLAGGAPAEPLRALSGAHG
jgi:acetyltransferase-like isoleucine patch superfamily enzyme